MKYWVTKEGEKIPYNKIKDSHLLNILQWIEKRAEEGIRLDYGGGFDLDDIWFDSEYLKGREVKDHFDYKGLLKEAKKRKIK